MTYDQSINKWINKDKPEYELEELKDVDLTTNVPTDLSYLGYDQINQNWRPYQMESDNVNKIRFLSIVADQPINTQLIGGFNCLQLLVQTASLNVQIVNPDNCFTVLNSTQLQINVTGEYLIGLSFQSNQANSNCILIINGTQVGVSPRADNNNCASLNLCSTFSSNMIISFALDVVGSIDNVAGFILY